MDERAKPNPVEFVTIQGGQYPLKSIKDIEPHSEPLMASQRIEYKGRCRGQYSIQFRIMQEWKSKKRDMTYDEFAKQAYDYLYTVRDKWCDYKKNTCYCNDDYQPEGKMDQTLLDVEKVFGKETKSLA